MSKKLQNIKAINQMLDGTHKFQTKKHMLLSNEMDSVFEKLKIQMYCSPSEMKFVHFLIVEKKHVLAPAHIC